MLGVVVDKKPSKMILNNEESSDHEEDKNQRYAIRTRSNKEPEIIEILTSSDDEETNGENRQKRKDDEMHLRRDKIDFNEFRDETHSFRPWSILHTDIEAHNFKLNRPKINSDFEFNISIQFVRFGSYLLNGGFAQFKSNKGISLTGKGNLV